MALLSSRFGSRLCLPDKALVLRFPFPASSSAIPESSPSVPAACFVVPLDRPSAALVLVRGRLFGPLLKSLFLCLRDAGKLLAVESAASSPEASREEG